MVTPTTHLNRRIVCFAFLPQAIGFRRSHAKITEGGKGGFDLTLGADGSLRAWPALTFEEPLYKESAFFIGNLLVLIHSKMIRF